MILQTRIPFDTSPRKLPGILPFDPKDWIIVDEAYRAQMQEKGRLLHEAPEEVMMMDPSALPASQELLAMVLDHLPDGFDHSGQAVICPDGRQVRLDWQAPMACLGALVQEDFCILQKHGNEHVLTAAILCFPAGWTLAEKAMRPLIRIHAPVDEYDEDLAKRVQRLFDGIRPGKPLWRFNLLNYQDPTLFQPRLESDPRGVACDAPEPFLRSERQTLMRLPDTGAVAFGIHTYVLRQSNG